MRVSVFTHMAVLGLLQLLLHLGFVPVELRKESDVRRAQHYAGLLLHSELKALLISLAMNETI